MEGINHLSLESLEKFQHAQDSSDRCQKSNTRSSQHSHKEQASDYTFKLDNQLTTMTPPPPP
jgi:hypothetical protein